MSITQMEMRGCIRQEQRLQRTRIRKSVFRPQLVLKAGAIPFRLRQPAPFLQPDTWWNGFYPFIDYSTGGSIDGMIRATERNLTIVTDKTIIIPGHGPVGNKAGLTEYHDMLVAI